MESQIDFFNYTKMERLIKLNPGTRLVFALNVHFLSLALDANQKNAFEEKDYCYIEFVK